MRCNSPRRTSTSRISRISSHKTCTSCHFDPAAPPGHPDVWREFAGDVHGRGLIVAGLTVSATCVSCHGKHDIRRADDPAYVAAWKTRDTLHELCIRLHYRGRDDGYAKSDTLPR